MSEFSERVVFASVFEALARVVVARDPGLSAALLGIGVDLEHLDAGYPVETWKAATGLVAERVFPDKSPKVAEYRLGQEIIREYANTLVGRALIATLRLFRE